MDVCSVSRTLRLEEVEDGYRHGIFPMAGERPSLVTWHRPPVRAVIPLERFHVPRSVERTFRRGGFQITRDAAFEQVMRACADRETTWISEEFVQVYGQLHRQGKAHSIEVWVGRALVGGLYGVHLGGAFFAESMFHHVTDMSKVALVDLARHLKERDFLLLEVQYLTPHLARFGAIEISHREYLRRLQQALAVSPQF